MSALATRCGRCLSNPAQFVGAPVAFEDDDLCIDCDREINALACNRCEGIGLVEFTGPAGVPHLGPCPDCHTTERLSE